jgi:fucose permease
MVSLIMLTFFVISFLTNITGPLVPAMIKGFHLSLTLVAVLPFAFFIAYGVMSVPAGMLNERYGEKKIMTAAFAVAFAGALLLALLPGYVTAVLSLFLIGCGMAMLQVVINPLLRTAGGQEHYAFNSVLAQLVFGLASFVSPLVYSGLTLRLAAGKARGGWLFHLCGDIVPEGLSWIALYWVFGLVCLLMIVVVLLSRFPRVELQSTEKAGTLAVHLRLLKKPVVLLFFAGIFCYVGTEQGIANWMSQYLYLYHGYDPQTTGAREVALFWGLMTAGGVLGLFLLKIMDSRRVLILFTAAALAALTAGLAGGGAVALVALPLTGFFASVMYPIVFSLALNSLDKHHGAFSGILLTGVTGGAVIPLVIGWAGDHFGLRTGMLLIYVTMAYILVTGFWARPLVVNKTIKRKAKVKNAPPLAVPSDEKHIT